MFRDKARHQFVAMSREERTDSTCAAPAILRSRIGVTGAIGT